MSAFTVLVIEDDAGLCTIYERILHKMGCDVLIARDGRTALELLTTYQPDLIFLDVYLPMMNGIAVLEAIATMPKLAHVPVVVSSSSRDFERHVQQFPNAKFILKPILPTQIRDAVEDLRQLPR